MLCSASNRVRDQLACAERVSMQGSRSLDSIRQSPDAALISMTASF